MSIIITKYVKTQQRMRNLDVTDQRQHGCGALDTRQFTRTAWAGFHKGFNEDLRNITLEIMIAFVFEPLDTKNYNKIHEHSTY